MRSVVRLRFEDACKVTGCQSHARQAPSSTRGNVSMPCSKGTLQWQWVHPSFEGAVTRYNSLVGTLQRVPVPRGKH